MALNDNALTTVANVETFLGLASGTDTAIIEILIDSASAHLEIILGRKLKNRTYTDARIDGNGRTFLPYPEYPLNTITALVVEDSDQQIIETIDVVLANKKILIDREAGIAHLMESVFVTGRQNIKTTFTAGLNSGASPDSIQLRLLEQAVIIMVQSMYVNRGLRDQFLRTERIGDYSYSKFATAIANLDAYNSLPLPLKESLLELKRV